MAFTGFCDGDDVTDMHPFEIPSRLGDFCADLRLIADSVDRKIRDAAEAGASACIRVERQLNIGSASCVAVAYCDRDLHPIKGSPTRLNVMNISIPDRSNVMLAAFISFHG